MKKLIKALGLPETGRYGMEFDGSLFVNDLKELAREWIKELDIEMTKQLLLAIKQHYPTHNISDRIGGQIYFIKEYILGEEVK